VKKHGIEYRKYVIGGVAVLIVTIYIIRLFTLQLMSDDYKKNADSNAFLKKIDYPSRGIITARNGELMVYNQPAYAKHHLDTMELCQTLDITREDFDTRMSSIKDRSKNPGYSPFTQQVFMNQLSDEEFSMFQEKIYRFPGFYVQKRSVRQSSRPRL